MKKFDKTVLLIDGNSVLYRAFYSTSYSSGGDIMQTSWGEYTNAIKGFINIFLKLYNKYKFDEVYVALDKGKSTFRHKIYDQYKKNRNMTPLELVGQFTLLRNFLKQSGIIYFEHDEYEADDIVGTISSIIKKDESTQILIASSDKDLYQLIDKNVFVIYQGKASNKEILLDSEAIYEKEGHYPNQVPSYKGICGDSSDNIKGVKGVGNVSTNQLLSEYISLDEIYKNIDKIEKPRIKNALIEYKEQAFFSEKLATIILDVPLNDFSRNRFSLNVNGISDFLNKYEMHATLSLIQRTFNFPHNQVENIKSEDQIEDFIFIRKWDDEINPCEVFVYFETNFDNYHNANPIGFAIATKNYTYFYKPIFNKETRKFDKNSNIEKFVKFINDSKVNIYDLKKFVYFFKSIGFEINMKNIEFDLMIACYLIDSNVPSDIYSQINLITQNNNNNNLDFELIFGKKYNKRSDEDFEKNKNYLVNCVKAIQQNKSEIIAKLKKINVYDLFLKVEMEFAKLLVDIEWNGIFVDIEEKNRLTKMFKSLIDECENKIKKCVNEHIGDSFNISSPMQVKELLFTKLKLKDYEKGSTSKDVLEKLINDHEVINYLLEHRNLTSTLSTSLNGIDKHLDKNNFIHTIYNQTLTTTGRLSSSEPNIQNISTNDERQKIIRKIFKVRNEKNVFISFDYSQIELRVVADMAKEEYMLNSFNNDKDIHIETANLLFSENENALNGFEKRRIAKKTNFGILYGQGSQGLGKELKIPLKESKKIIENYFKNFKNLKAYQNELIEFAKNFGYVMTVANRRRYIKEFKSKIAKELSLGKRLAINSPIQGTAADILKMAMINTQKNNVKNIKIIAQIHDEIIIECLETDANEILNEIKIIMENAFIDLCKTLNNEYKPIVKLVVNYKIGKNWLELK